MMQLDPKVAGSGRAAHRARPARIDQCRGAARSRARASAARSGSRRSSRPRAAAGAADLDVAGGQSVRHACCSPIRPPPSIGRNCRSSPRSRCTTRSPNWRPQLRPRLAIKWPNDLLLGRRQVRRHPDRRRGAGAVAVGIGVNCTSHPAGTAYPATDLAAGRREDLGRRALFAALVGDDAGTARAVEPGREHFATIRADWLARAAGRRRADPRAAWRTASSPGRFETIDETGRLVLLRPDGGRETIAAGRRGGAARLRLARRGRRHGEG